MQELKDTTVAATSSGNAAGPDATEQSLTEGPEKACC